MSVRSNMACPAMQDCTGRGSAFAQLGCLLLDIICAVSMSFFRSLSLAARLFLVWLRKEFPPAVSDEVQKGEFSLYEGKVWHERRKPVLHSFEYRVRYALINLDHPPPWFDSSHHLSASQARAISATTGPVHLLTMPTSVGYEQNPLSVYYCYDEQGRLVQCIAEVTNTPWAERVTFLFSPGLDLVAKPLHVSPFMDMKGVWQLRAAQPGQELLLHISVQHPELGTYFRAILQAQRVDQDQVSNAEAFTWLMPHKVALWIYWQALLLIWKGVAFIPHPKYTDGDAYRKRAQHHDTHLHPTASQEEKIDRANGHRAISQRYCTWQEAAAWPWK